MVSAGVLERGRGTRAGRVTLSLRRTTIVVRITDLKLSHFLFEISDIFAAITDVGVDTLLYERVVGGLPHITSGSDEGLLPLDLSVDRGNNLVAFHDGQAGRGWRVGCGGQGKMGGGGGGKGFRGALVDRGATVNDHFGKCEMGPTHKISSKAILN
jgi:hypothetical protein